ncbi:MAG: Flp pilus assembly complex ATPase component TadA [Cyanobacteria bacterium SZAS-4]|nr:Flp pilus assembly complex ATPase component TadA [Cyanobacteria bacterium SZAS-4]
MASTRKAIGDLLVDNGQITPEELEQAEAERAKTGEPIGSVLSKLGFITEGSLKNALELQYGVNYVNLAKREPEYELIALIPEAIIRAQMVVPVSREGDRVTVAMVDPSDSAAVDEVKKKLDSRQLKTVVCLEEEFFRFVDKAFAVEEQSDNGSALKETSNGSADASHSAGKSDVADDDIAASERIPDEDSAVSETKPAESKPLYDEPEIYSTQEMRARPGTLVDPKELENKQKELSPDSFNEVDLARRAQEEAIVLLANQILGSAIKRHCSNIHISMGARESIVHYRLSGRLIVDRKLPNTVVTALVARYKMMARLNLAERKEPQDGHIKVKSASKEIVCLISVIPTDHGESIVIWIV